MKPYIFKLSELLTYTPKGEGEFQETGSIEFDPPSMNCDDEATEFEQIIMRSMMSASKGQDSEKEEAKSLGQIKAPTASEMRVILFASEISVRDVMKKFKKLAIKTGRLDEKTYLKESHFNKMCREDMIDMLCGYSSFFTFPSLLRGDEPETSGSN